MVKNSKTNFLCDESGNPLSEARHKLITEARNPPITPVSLLFRSCQLLLDPVHRSLVRLYAQHQHPSQVYPANVYVQVVYQLFG